MDAWTREVSRDEGGDEDLVSVTLTSRRSWTFASNDTLRWRETVGSAEREVNDDFQLQALLRMHLGLQLTEPRFSGRGALIQLSNRCVVGARDACCQHGMCMTGVMTPSRLRLSFMLETPFLSSGSRLACNWSLHHASALAGVKCVPRAVYARLDFREWRSSHGREWDHVAVMHVWR